MMKKILNLLIILILPFSLVAQTSRKPSPMRATKAELNQKATTAKKSLAAIKTQAQFDSLARTYNQNTPYALPHLIFVIDRKDKNKIYYINSKIYTFHKDFVNGTYLSLERGEAFSKNYTNSNRRFILGTLAYQIPLKKHTFEFWEGDLIPAEQIKLTHEIINKTFFEKVSYKPNSLRQEDASANLGITRILQSEITQGQEYVALNVAKGIGRVHVIEKLDDTVEIGYNEILVLKEVPLNLPPVAGIIIAEPSTPLSHINLLAKGWGIPNVYIKNAFELFKPLNETWIELDAKQTSYKIKKADKKTLDQYDAEQKAKGLVLRSPPANLEVKKLATLAEFRKKDSIIYGAKGANLAEIYNAKIPNIVVADGFGIPFVYCQKFMETNGFEDEMIRLLDDQTFVHNPIARRKMLEEFRAKIQAGKFDEKLKAEIIQKWQSVTKGRGVFVRSSSNAEDLPNFSGAGLYTTVPNVKDGEKLIEAVKTVWASLWNFDAYEARERALIDHTGVYMGVLVQEAVDSESSGVMITKDPFDKFNKGAIYISAKRGLGIKVVEGARIAEQILFAPKSNSVQILTRSAEDSLLKLDANGGVIEVPIDGERRVLTDEVARNLAKTAARIKVLFGAKEQDIEWGYAKGKIFIFQSRPFIEGK